MLRLGWGRTADYVDWSLVKPGTSLEYTLKPVPDDPAHTVVGTLQLPWHVSVRVA